MKIAEYIVDSGINRFAFVMNDSYDNSKVVVYLDGQRLDDASVAFDLSTFSTVINVDTTSGKTPCRMSVYYEEQTKEELALDKYPNLKETFDRRLDSPEDLEAYTLLKRLYIGEL
jgi:hypothetical protein